MSTETLEFKTEMKQLMDIIVHSLYSHKEIFLRELISNAADAIDKVRFESLTNEDLLEDNAEWKIKLTTDESARTLTISDNGSGMSRDSIAENLGTIARSGTRAFLEQLEEAKDSNLPELIGQFGVGFYSSFMVADEVTVISRQAGDKSHGVKWHSGGHGSYTLEDVEKETRGTDVILHLKDDEKEFLDEWRLRQVVKKFSDFIEHPVVMDVEREVEEESDDDEKEEKEEKEKKKVVEEETLNSQQAIWLRPRDEVTEEQHKEFYKHISHDFQDPAKTIHYAAEGVIEFRALLYLPSQKPFDLFMPEAKTGLHLYIKRVFIMDDCADLIPEYLRFMKGVVDASDLPLNVSREILQQNPQLEKIRKNLTNKILDTVSEMKEKEYDDYVAFYGEFGPVLKEGIHSDYENKDKLADLLLFRSTKSGDDAFVTLKDYVDAMPSDQEEIYYLIGEKLEDIQGSPYLEAFKSRGQEVLFMTDPVDEWIVQGLHEYGGKSLKAVDKGDVSADKEAEKTREKDQETFKDLLGSLNDKLDEVKEVRISTRLTDSASCLVAEEGDMGAHMERLMRKMGREGDMPESKRILELNASHPTVAGLQTLYDQNADDPRVEVFGRLLYEQAVIAEGSKIKDPSAFAQRINDLMAKDLGATGS
jgi:molecular chaperone HtpG